MERNSNQHGENAETAPQKDKPKPLWAKAGLGFAFLGFLGLMISSASHQKSQPASQQPRTKVPVKEITPRPMPVAAASPAPSPTPTDGYNETAMILQGVEAKDAIKRLLRDPDSAEFSDVVAHDIGQGQFVFCGVVNAKNGFGGYSGGQAFVTIRGAIAAIDDGSKSFRATWLDACTEKARAHRAYF